MAMTSKPPSTQIKAANGSQTPIAPFRIGPTYSIFERSNHITIAQMTQPVDKERMYEQAVISGPFPRNDILLSHLVPYRSQLFGILKTSYIATMTPSHSSLGVRLVVSNSRSFK